MRGRESWIVVFVVGALYALVGILFAIPSDHVKRWRLAAWAVSAIAYAAHLLYQRFRIESAAARGSFQVALAVALGAFGLAVGANLSPLTAGDTERHRRLLQIALVAWPIVTAIPAFLLALVASAILGRGRRKPEVATG